MEALLALAALVLALALIATSSAKPQNTQDDYLDLLAENRGLRAELHQRRDASGSNGCLILAILVLAGILLLALAPGVQALIR